MCVIFALVFATIVAGKTTAIRRICVRETRIFRHHGGPIEGPLNPPVHHSTILLRDLREPLNGLSLCWGVQTLGQVHVRSLLFFPSGKANDSFIVYAYNYFIVWYYG